MIFDWITAHPALSLLAAYYIFSAATGALPIPDKDSHFFYRWFFGFTNTLSANIARAYAAKGIAAPEPPKDA